MTRNLRTLSLLALTAGLSVTLAGCSSSDTSNADNVATVVVTETAGQAPSTAPSSKSPSSATTSKTPKDGKCKAPVVALDPGHNGATIGEFDPETGIAMRDYSNGMEDEDVLAVAKSAKRQLEADGYTVVLLKEKVTDSVSYRERVDRAEKAGADIGISIHTYTSEDKVFDQRVGAYREGDGPDGQTIRVEFTDADVAKKSGAMSRKFAAARTKVEGREVFVTQNSFDGRPPLWSGNIPVISLISDEVPWVYNEFGNPDRSGGGANPIGADGRRMYAESIVAGTEAALPNHCN